MTNHVYWMLELAVNDGHLDQFKTLMEEMFEATKKNEPGVLNYEWWLNDDKTVCHIYERYEDSDAVMVHMGNFREKFVDRFMSHVVPTGLTIYGNADDRVREGLASLKPVYMHAFGGFSR